MSSLSFSLLAGLGFGLFAVLIMLPMPFDDKPQALLAAFFSRFSIGFLVPNLDLPWPLWLSGLVVGILISLSDAIVTRAHAPILVVGGLGGALVGWLAGAMISV
ncbi:MAG TPA: hypothetical protein ENJ26_02845 [Rhodobacteraceae bacterium]|nr:hypothetical protein [Paracoccaceae bacterium]